MSRRWLVVLEDTKSEFTTPEELESFLGAHPVLFGFSPALEFERFDDAGGYPKGFLQLG